MVALVYQWSHHYILQRHWGTSKAIRRYCSGTRVPVKPRGDSVVALGYQWSHKNIL